MHRRDKDKVIAATRPDQEVTWVESDHILRAEIWTYLILPRGGLSPVSKLT